ncbi:hypothetical protein CBER1_07788 [Cercospora berteroae]|uniref:F-box domain-containing protein n=1 Tax=Cercospora berteroae TaxID=357750 RepID=A0A2S6BUB2_9PEZI|nr:hypothetical protein CBER1_07788 [Cercospora berteroae]
MHFDHLPSELLTQIFLSLPSISSAIALSSANSRFYDTYHLSKKLDILRSAAESEFGPIQDVVQVLTQNHSQPAHIQRDVPISDAFLRQIVKAGRIAQRYEEIYTFKKWKTDYANRRLLSNSERYKLRRAIYRLWLYDKAFHNAAHVRTCRTLPGTVFNRTALLHNWTNTELAEMMDVHNILKDMVANNICPSNGKIRQKFSKRFPDSNQQLLFNIHLNYPPAPSSFVPDGWYHNSATGSSRHQSRLFPSRFHEPGAEGWGDEISHYYIVEDMMKLDPEQLLYLRDNCPLKAQVEMHVRGLGDWFVNNGETFSETVAHVMTQRGENVEEWKMRIEDGEAGIAVSEE